jgi:hypothetical protein
MANQIKSFQGYVNQSLMDAGQHKPNDYLIIMTRLFKQGHLNMEQVFMFMRTLVRNHKLEPFRKYLDNNYDMRRQLIETVEYGWITKDGEYTEHCLKHLTELGYGETLGESTVKEEE